MTTLTAKSAILQAISTLPDSASFADICGIVGSYEPVEDREQDFDRFLADLPPREGGLEADSPGFEAELHRRLVSFLSGESPGVSGREFFDALKRQ